MTLTSCRLSDRLCHSHHESVFLEAILRHAVYKITSEPAQPIRMTHDQIRQIVRGLDPEIAWDNQQFERLKTKYVCRPGRPATVFQMLRETVKGQRGTGGHAGTPSEYQPTGMRLFLTEGQE